MSPRSIKLKLVQDNHAIWLYARALHLPKSEVASKEIRLVIDTGASTSILPLDVASELSAIAGQENLVYRAGGSETREVRGIAGAREQGTSNIFGLTLRGRDPSIMWNSMQVGKPGVIFFVPLARKRVWWKWWKPVTQPDWPCDARGTYGILGLDFLQRFRARLHIAENEGALAGVLELPLSRTQGLDA